MLKHLPYHAKLSLLQTLNVCWTTNTFPIQWKESIIIPIPKQNQDAGTINGFRPISLTSCIAKTFERMINRRLITILEENKQLDIRQHAFRKGKGTGSYFSCLDQYLEDAITNNHHCELALLDLSKAYDMTWKWNIIKTLNNWGIEGRLLNIIQNFLSDRSFRVAVGGKLSGLKSQENGIPQ